MKQLYEILLPLAVTAWILVFLPFSNEITDYILVGAGAILAIAALIVKQNAQQKSQQQHCLTLTEQQKSLSLIEAKMQTIGHKQVAEQQQVNEQIKVLQTIMNELKIATLNSAEEAKATQKEQANTFENILDRNAKQQQVALEEAFATLIESQQTSAGKIIETLNTQTMNLTMALNDLNRPLQDIQDAIKDLEERINSKTNDMIDRLEDIPEGYKPLIDQIASYSDQITDYTEQMNYIQTNVVTFTQQQLKEATNISKILQQSVSELASSKHAERQQAMKVQQKLLEQYAKLT